MEPILNLAYWTEDIEVKDVVFYIESVNGRALSFFVKKYHDEVYVKEHNLDDLFDEITESDVDYGGVLVEQATKKRPKVMSLTKLAFCDQTDVLGGPLAFKLYLSPSKLKKMEKNGWFKTENAAKGTAQELIELATATKDPEGGRKGDKENVTPGKNIEVYIMRGPLPKAYLDDGDDMETIENQVQIVASYFDEKKNRQGFVIYRKKENEGSLKFFTSQVVSGRGLGRGWGERMLHPQIWTNFLEIHKTQMLQAGAKTPLMTDDTSFTNANKINEMENNEITIVSKDSKLPPTPIQTINPANVRLYDKSINEWFEFAQYAGAAFDPLMGKQATSGTTFRGQERVVAQGRGPHDRLRGKRAKFIEEIYRDWILPEIKREIVNGKKFLATLTADEMQWVTDQLAENYASRQVVEDVLEGKVPRDKEILKAEFATNFRKKGSQRLIEILKDEFRDVEIKIGINIAGKQKDLSGLSDKLLSIFQFVFANPQAFQQAMQIPGMSKTFSDILEYSGVNQADFMSFVGSMPTPSTALGGGETPELSIPRAEAVTA